MIEFNSGVTALRAFSLAQNVTAHNVANVNTEEFKASRTTMEELPERSGVQVQEIRKTTAHGPLVPVIRPELDESSGRMVQTEPLVEGSNTDLAREMVNMTVNERSFQANAAVIRTRDDMIGGLMDEIA